jgi:hypothetical protein
VEGSLKYLAVVAAVLALTGCSGDSESDLSKARKFDRYPLYYLGDSFSGERLVEVSSPYRIRGSNTVTPYTFIYGTCEAKSDQGCSPPFVLQNYSICDENPLAHSNAPGAGYQKIRGALLGGNELYTGSTTVRGLQPETVLSLRPVKGHPSVGSDLPPPAFPRSMLRKLRFDRRFKDRRPLRQLLATFPRVRPTRC